VAVLPGAPVILLGLALLAGAILVRSAPAAEPRVVELSIRGGALPEAQRVVRLTQGEEVVLRWTSDTPVAIHLHGYDIERKLAPGAPATMQFRARATGRFPVTVHGEGKGERPLGYVEVHPR
jgi:hypothetical protein